MAVGDLDGANGPDLALANLFSNNVSVLLNQGDGTFAAAAAYLVGHHPRSVAIGDLDGVNGPDLAIANEGNEFIWPDVWVLPNLCTAEPCPWDCEDPPDGTVDVGDFLALLGQWHTPGSCDFDGGDVHVTDFLIMLAHWGPSP